MRRSPSLSLDFSTAGEIKARGKPGNESNCVVHVRVHVPHIGCNYIYYSDIIMSMYTCAHTCTYTCIHGHVHAHTHTCTHMHSHTCTLSHTHTHTHTHAHTHALSHTLTHTYAQSLGDRAEGADCPQGDGY